MAAARRRPRRGVRRDACGRRSRAPASTGCWRCSRATTATAAVAGHDRRRARDHPRRRRGHHRPRRHDAQPRPVRRRPATAGAAPAVPRRGGLARRWSRSRPTSRPDAPTAPGLIDGIPDEVLAAVGPDIPVRARQTAREASEAARRAATRPAPARPRRGRDDRADRPDPRAARRRCRRRPRRPPDGGALQPQRRPAAARARAGVRAAARAHPRDRDGDVLPAGPRQPAVRADLPGLPDADRPPGPATRAAAAARPAAAAHGRDRAVRPGRGPRVASPCRSTRTRRCPTWSRCRRRPASSPACTCRSSSTGGW